MAVQPNQQLTLDDSQQKGFVSFFKSLPQKAATTVRLFDRGEYYTAHGSDATLSAQIVFETTAAVKQIGSSTNSTESLVLNKNNFETLIRELLLVREYRVEVYCNKSNTKAGNNWVVEYKGSPGNLSQFEDLLWGSESSEFTAGTVVMAIQTFASRKSVAVALTDTAERQFKVVHFPDDEQWSTLEGLVVQMQPRECLVPEQAHEDITKMLERSGVLVTHRKKADWSADGMEQDLNRLVAFTEGQQRNSLALPQMDLTAGIQALAALIKYLELLSDASNESQFSVSTLELNRFVRLDAAAVRALNLLPSSRSTNKQHSLLGLVDKCRTAQGHRLVARWVMQPLCDVNAIRERQDIIEALMNNGEMRQELSDEHLRRMPDLVALGNKLARSKVNLQDCFRVYQAVGRVPALIELLSGAEDCAAVTAQFLTPLRDLAQDLQRYQMMIETTLDLETALRGEFLVKPDFDDDLRELREKMDDLEAQMKKQLTRAARDLSLEPQKTLKLESNPQHGYFYRVTLKEEKSLRNNKDYRILDTTKAGIRFRDDQLTELNTEYMDLRSSYSNHQSSVVQEIVNIASGYSSVVRRLGSVVANIDVLAGWAVLAASAPTQYVRPSVSAPGGGRLRLDQVRHPCVEVQDGINYIPSDVDLSHDDITQYIVTGPNMGGKSTFIRSVGVVVLMAQMGCYVPCARADISLVDAILARVGADDSQLKGMSTFMNEMVETAAMIRTATKNSLLIVDELGRGTSTFDGCGMAWAIAEHLACNVKSLTLFATHFHELADLTSRYPNISNRHVTAATDEDQLTLLYAVQPGFCDQSFGLHVAKLAAFPAAVLEFAARKQAQLEALQVHASREQAEADAGEKLMQEFLDKVMQLVIDGVTGDEFKQRMAQLKADVKAADNAYIRALVS